MPPQQARNAKSTAATACRERLHSALGQTVLALSIAPLYRHSTLADLHALVIKPLLRDGIAIASTPPAHDGESEGTGLGRGRLSGAPIPAHGAARCSAVRRSVMQSSLASRGSSPYRATPAFDEQDQPASDTPGVRGLEPNGTLSHQCVDLSRGPKLNDGWRCDGLQLTRCGTGSCRCGRVAVFSHHSLQRIGNRIVAAMRNQLLYGADYAD
jgi:hypothetical protein